MNWLKNDAIYLPSDIAEEIKDGIDELTSLVAEIPVNRDKDSSKKELAVYKLYDLMDKLIFHAIDGIPEDMQDKIEGEIKANMLCVYPGGAGYEFLGNLRTSKGGCCVGAK